MVDFFKFSVMGYCGRGFLGRIFFVCYCQFDVVAHLRAGALRGHPFKTSAICKGGRGQKLVKLADG